MTWYQIIETGEPCNVNTVGAFTHKYEYYRVVAPRYHGSHIQLGKVERLSFIIKSYSANNSIELKSIYEIRL